MKHLSACALGGTLLVAVLVSSCGGDSQPGTHTDAIAGDGQGGDGKGGDGQGGAAGSGGDGAAGSGGDGAAGSGGDGAAGSGGDGAAGSGGDGAAGAGGGAGMEGGGAGAGGGAGTEAPTGPGPGCVPGATQCTDCVDNDGDGLTDYYDPECVGPLDNDESSYATGIPGDNMDACKQDCFFDGNSGMGDDKCEWELKCDPKNPGKDLGCPYDPDYKNCPAMQKDECIKKCAKFAPNGCDCFGCCTLMGHDVLLVPTCTPDKLDDAKACPPCTKSTSCNNPCDKCEICLDKPTIPDDCPRPDGGLPGVDSGVPGDGGAGDGGVPGDSGMPGDGGVPPDDGGVVDVPVPDPDGPPPPDDGGVPPPPPDGPPPPPPPSCPSGVTPCGPGGVDPASCPPMTVCVTGCCINYVP